MIINDLYTDIKTTITEPDQHKDGRAKKQAAIAGTVTGSIVALMIGISRKWNAGWSVLSGAAIGGLIAYLIAPQD